MDAEPVGVVVESPSHGERLAGPAPIAGDVPREDVELGLARDDPLGQLQAEAGALAKARDNAAANVVVFEFGNRPEKRRGIGRPDHRAVDHPLDPRGGEHRDAYEGPLDVRRDALEVIGQELLPEIEGRALHGPETCVLLVGAAEEALALLPQVVFAVSVGDGRQLPIECCDLWDRLRDEILVLQSHQRQVEAGKPRQLARP